MNKYYEKKHPIYNLKKRKEVKLNVVQTDAKRKQYINKFEI